jgi:hypothetical protein
LRGEHPVFFVGSVAPVNGIGATERDFSCDPIEKRLVLGKFERKWNVHNKCQGLPVSGEEFQLKGSVGTQLASPHPEIALLLSFEGEPSNTGTKI